MAERCYLRALRIPRRDPNAQEKDAETPNWLEEISVDRYRPMSRLLKEDDYEFLQSQPGFTPAMTEEIRLQRCRIFRAYLNSLEADFATICSVMALVMPGKDLLRYRMLFRVEMAVVRLRLSLYRWHLADVDSGAIVHLFDLVRRELCVPLAATR